MSSRHAFLLVLAALTTCLAAGSATAQPIGPPPDVAPPSVPSRSPAGATPPPLVLEGFLDPQPVAPLLAPDLPGAIEAFAQAAEQLEAASLRLEAAYQVFIQGVAALETPAAKAGGDEPCGTGAIGEAYLRIRDTWKTYRRQTRVVRDRYRGLDAYHAAGYAPGLMPDVEARLEAAAALYARLGRQHLAWRALMQRQVAAEAERLGCPYLEVPSVPDVALAETPGNLLEGDTVGAEPGVPAGEMAVQEVGTAAPIPHTADSAQHDTGAGHGLEPGAQPAETAAGDATAPDATATRTHGTPLEPDSGGTAPGVATSSEPGGEMADEPRPATREPASGPAEGEGEGSEPPSTAHGAEQLEEVTPSGVEVQFAVDNSSCDHGVVLYLDGRRIGTVPGGASAEFSAPEGRHTVCLGSETAPHACESSSQQIEIMLYDGFALRPGC